MNTTCRERKVTRNRSGETVNLPAIPIDFDHLEPMMELGKIFEAHDENKDTFLW